MKVLRGDCMTLIKEIETHSIDAVVTDPPYALVSIQKRFGKPGSAPVKVDEFFDAAENSKGASPYKRASAGFMGKQWDVGDVAHSAEFWAEVLRVLKPGGYVLAFGGTRTYHRLACAIEDAGFEVRDMVSWLYGSGFPKSHDVSKGIDKAAGACREVVGTYNARGFSDTSPTNDGRNQWAAGEVSDKVGTITAPATEAAREWQGWGTALKPACEPICMARKPLSEATVAANVLRWGTGAINVDGCRVTSESRPLVVSDRRSGANNTYGDGLGGSVGIGDTTLGRWPANVIHDGSDEVVSAFPNSKSCNTPSNAKPTGTILGGARSQGAIYPGENGSAARFFYSAKASKAERAGSKHPTVKPLALMQYLARLVTPKGGTILDPFAGTGTTALAAMAEGFDCILIEREVEYIADFYARIAATQEAVKPVLPVRTTFRHRPFRITRPKQESFDL